MSGCAVWGWFDEARKIASDVLVDLEHSLVAVGAAEVEMLEHLSDLGAGH
jgi:hypothetical protein